MKLILSVLAFVCSWSYIALAQQILPSPEPMQAVPVGPIVNAAIAQVGVMGWINAHGGFQAAVLLLVGSAFCILSAIRQVLLNFDGVGPGQDIPADQKALTILNKVCLALGKVIDFIQGNVKH